MVTDDDLAWAVEQACLNAWPAPRQLVFGRWLLRAAGGPSRRINSLNPLRAHLLRAHPSRAHFSRAHAYDPAEAIDAATPILAALGRPLVVRAPAIATGLQARLVALGFVPQHETRTLYMPLDAVDPVPVSGVIFMPEPTEAWLERRARISVADPVADGAARSVLASILLPKSFVAVPGPDGIAAIAFGAIDRGLLVVEAVATDPAARGRGFGAAAVSALLGWGKRQGARGVCLQVVALNTPALRLYARLGFANDLYRYTYCCRSPIP